MTNIVCFSQYLTAYKCWSELSAALARQQVDYALLPNTKDIWMRDFMPVQCTPDHFVAYRYEPDYLCGQSQYITNWKHVIAPSRLHYDTPRPHKWNWAYINYLLTDGKLFLPRLNAEDEQACAQIGSALGVPREHIELVDITGVLRNGGGLNCISWNVSLYDSIL